MEKKEYLKRLNFLNEELKNCDDKDLMDLIKLEKEELIKTAMDNGYNLTSEEETQIVETINNSSNSSNVLINNISRQKAPSFPSINISILGTTKISSKTVTTIPTKKSRAG